MTSSTAAVPTTVVPSDHEYDEPPVAIRLILDVLQVSSVVEGALIAAAGNGFTLTLRGTLFGLIQELEAPSATQ